MSPFILLVVVLNLHHVANLSMQPFPSEADCQRASVTVLAATDNGVITRCIASEAPR